MKKRGITALLLGVLAALVLAGCAPSEEAAALTAGRWQRVEYLPEETAENILRSADLYDWEIACMDLSAMGIVRRAEFREDMTYRIAYDIPACRGLAREYLDGALRTLAENRQPLAAQYRDLTGTDPSGMTGEEFLAFYAGCFGCESYEALLDRMTGTLYGYEALGTFELTGTYSVRGEKLFLTPTGAREPGSVPYTMNGGRLTLLFENAPEEYTDANIA